MTSDCEFELQEVAPGCLHEWTELNGEPVPDRWVAMIVLRPDGDAVDVVVAVRTDIDDDVREAAICEALARVRSWLEHGNADPMYEWQLRSDGGVQTYLHPFTVG